MTASERLIAYAKYDTASDPDSASSPSTEKQKRLSEALARELAQLGLADARTDDYGYVYASLPASKGAESATAIGLIAHVDTSPDAPGANVRPRIVKNYQGGDITLNEQQGISLSPRDYPYVEDYRGQDLIVTDGTTLLGADDKAGVAEIMTALERIISEKLPHCALKIAFTPDEEVGRGVDHFDVKGFAAPYAYTVDGGLTDSYNIETFNAASAEVIIHGRNIHPGDAKGKMRNASLIAMEFNALLPEHMRPDRTEGREGFYHLCSVSGAEEECRLRYIVRDHDRAEFERKKQRLCDIKKQLDEKYVEGTVELHVCDSYYNMREVLDNYPEIAERAVKAMKAVGVAEPKAVPVRGGTDGSRLSFMGLPCPNLPTGGRNGHSRFEFTSVQELNKVVDMLLALVRPM